MSSSPSAATSIRRRTSGSRFEQTSHTLLEKVRDGDGHALEELCSRYWYPLYTWLLASRMATSEPEAQDLVQGFFEKMLAKGSLANHHPQRGRFRSYLLTCLKNHVIDVIRKPSLKIIDSAVDDPDWIERAESRESADDAFEKAWAWELFEVAKDRIRRTWASEGQAELFDAFAPYLEGNRGLEGLEAVGTRFGLSHENTRIRLHRLKKLLRETLTKAVTSDLPEDATPEERSAEMRHFLEALLL